MAAFDGIEWQVTPGLTDYPAAVASMEERAAAIGAGEAAERVWLVEHPPLYTAGTSASAAELLAPDRFPVFPSGRGGRHTYHGPGQRVAYVQLDLNRRGRDVRRYVHALEGWALSALGRLGVTARTIDGKVGLWVDGAGGSAKLGAIGVRVRRWVTLHGLSINVDPDLSHFSGIVPCGLSEPVTSLARLGVSADMAALDRALATALPDLVAGLAHGKA